MSFFSGLSSIAGPVLTLAGAATGNPALAMAGVGMSSYSAMSAQKETNQANIDIANRQMQFQQDMSGTAYQRAVADMQAAGLNPMLAAFNGGASTPGGASTQVANPASPALNGAQQVAQIMNSSQQTQSNVDLQEAQRRQTDADTAIKVAQLPGHNMFKEQVLSDIERNYSSADQARNSAAYFNRLTKEGIPAQVARDYGSAKYYQGLGRLAEKGKAPTHDPYWYQDAKNFILNVIPNSARAGWQYQQERLFNGFK